MILDDFKLGGKVAVVTGAATGLGQGMAVGLAEAGADIVGIVHHSSVDETSRKVHAAGREFLALQADLGSIDLIEDVIRQAEERFGHLDILVNNAGGSFIPGTMDLSEGGWDAIVPGFIAGARGYVGGVIYLVSKAASYVTGQTLVIDGRLTSKLV